MFKRILHKILPSKMVTTIQQLRALPQANASDAGEISDFHYPVIRPEILSRWRPRIVEVGVLNGGHTWLLLGAAIRRFGELVSIDPSPGPAISLIMRILPCGRMIKTTSLEALAGLVDGKAVFDIAVLDGDHNYFTVSNELRLITELLSPNGAVYLHDVAWPYGRRDLYYDPERIPASARHSHAKRGIVKGQTALVESGGFNASVDNARHEGGPRNGVLTAVEDFLAEEGEGWSFERIDIQYGLGILRRIPRVATDANIS